MLLQIRHLTQYRYAGPVRESVMELWMQPQKTSRQRLINFDLSIDPAAQTFSHVDVYGNIVHHFDIPLSHDLLTIRASATVDTTERSPLPEALDMGEWDRLTSPSLRGDNYDFLRPHGFAIPTERLAAFVAERKLDDLRKLDPLTAIRALSLALYGSFAYVTGVTEADSPIDLALAARKGVCQDFTHIMIAICRSWGIPARYVSGYLFTDQQGDRSSPDATHAWVEVFLPSLRWIGIDPTNNSLANERHIAVAVGRDYNDVPPSRGVYKGDSESDLFVAVSVGRAKSALIEPELRRASRAPSPADRRRELNLMREQQQQQQ